MATGNRAYGRRGDRLDPGDLVARLRSAGVQEITIRLDKGFFSREMVAALEALGVSYVLKVPDHGWVRGRLSSYRKSSKDEAVWSRRGRCTARVC